MPAPGTGRFLIWQHNGFIGSAKMMQGQCKRIIASRTATPLAKSYATDILALSEKLTTALRTRNPL